MSLFHPKSRLPLWAALAIPAAAYLYRSISRGFDFRPDVPSDIIVFAVFAVGLGAIAWSRRTLANERDDKTADEDHDEGGTADNERQHNDVVRHVE